MFHTERLPRMERYFRICMHLYLLYSEWLDEVVYHFYVVGG